MNFSDQTFSSELPTRTLTKKLTIDNTITRPNKSVIKHKKQSQTKIDVEETTLLENNTQILRKR